jgi:hypothetical protein
VEVFSEWRPIDNSLAMVQRAWQWSDEAQLRAVNLGGKRGAEPAIPRLAAAGEPTSDESGSREASELTRAAKRPYVPAPLARSAGGTGD